MKQGFGKKQRICRSKDFQRIFKQGNTFRKSSCKVHVHPNLLAESRLAVIIAKKTISLSTRRHQFKRIVRESFRLNPERLAGFDIIVMIKRDLINKATLWSALDSIWQDINQWRSTL